MAYFIEMQSEVDAASIDTHALERLASHALEIERVEGPAELSILLADDPTIHELNRTYKQTDAPTDVLSFSQREGTAFEQPEGVAPHLGDVIISIDTARRQAAEYGLPLQDEVAHLLVHGTLHLLGYDHETGPEEAELMHLHEEAILGGRYKH